MLDYDFADNGKKMESAAGLFGALEAAVANLVCGLDDTFRKCDNGRCKGYNIDMPDLIAVRNDLLPESDRERRCALNV
ncbi:MAG: hypothetical protein K6A90_03310 [Lachnospiraceae bacterium]|nr:hypothetical protein [Lachnospiraceae bacterium]